MGKNLWVSDIFKTHSCYKMSYSFGKAQPILKRTIFLIESPKTEPFWEKNLLQLFRKTLLGPFLSDKMYFK